VITYKSPAEVAKMRLAGLVVARTLDRLREAVAPGVTTADLDVIAERTIREQGGTPSFLGYRGYPASICASVNEEIVHGIPRPTKKLKRGDIISIDCGAILDGWHGDSAITVPVGGPAAVAPEVLRMLEVCEDSMWAAFAAAKPGGRIRDLGTAVEKVVVPHGFGIVDGYGGHGIGTEMHQDPHVLNHSHGPRGPKLAVGLALAIEPMITMGDPDTRELEDHWTVVTRDGSWASHFEHSFVLTERGPFVLTAHDGGRERLGRLGVEVVDLPQAA
jgi:methionyl aminopeptidase